MIRFKFDIDKALSALLYISAKVNNPELHKIFKLLYFADQEHLCKYGRPIIGDTYIAMKDGPVPSSVYDIVKFVRGDNKNIFNSNIDFSQYFEIQGTRLIKPKIDADTEILSETDIECLDKSIIDNQNLTYQQRLDKSHNLAWNKANPNDKLDYQNIAKEGGASKEMLEYIKTISENHNL